MINEQFMALGDFSFRLKPDTPWEIRRLIRYSDSIIVTPTRVPHDQMDADDIKEAAAYRGVVLEHGPDRLDFGGNGPLWYLGNARGDGPNLGQWTVTEWDWSDHMLWISGQSGWNGVQLLAVVDEPSATWPPSGADIDELPKITRPRIEYLAGVLGVEYHLDPLGQLHNGGAGSSSIWTTDPTVILQRGQAGRDVGLVGLDLERWDVSGDFYDATVGAVVAGTEGGAWLPTSYFNTEPVYGASGTSPASIPGGYARIEEQSSNGGTGAASRAQYLATEVLSERRSIECSVNTYWPGRYMKPGDWLWCHDPANQIWNDGYNTWYHGRHLNPDKLRLFGMRWPLKKPMGLYRLGRKHSGGSPDSPLIVDLTDWYLPETGPATLEIEAPRRRALAA